MACMRWALHAGALGFVVAGGEDRSIAATMGQVCWVGAGSHGGARWWQCCLCAWKLMLRLLVWLLGGAIGPLQVFGGSLGLLAVARGSVGACTGLPGSLFAPLVVVVRILRCLHCPCPSFTLSLFPVDVHLHVSPGWVPGA